MLPHQRLVGPAFWEHFTRIATDAMIAYKNKNGIVEILFFFRCFYKLPVTKICVTKSIHFVIGLKAKPFERICGEVDYFECGFVFIGNTVRAVVIGCLYNGKKRFRFVSFCSTVFASKNKFLSLMPHASRFADL